MIHHVEFTMRRIRRWLSRSEWTLRLLKTAKMDTQGTEPGLIIIQIDGLSKEQLEAAIAKKRMPFVTKLLHTENYQLHTLYSGLPSSTPAFQGELFYGKKCAVPAFSFITQHNGQVVHMYQAAAAQQFEKILEKQTQGLLKGGSSYSNVFTGGAAEVNFCATSMGWDGLFKNTNAPTVLAFVLLNLYSFIRVFLLGILEFFIAITDFFRGLILGKDFLRELLMIPSRVAIAILLRELITIGAKLDIARGMPIIHLNFLGYDEQAHRRGPTSNYAHWSLKGIDDAIGRISRAAFSARSRDYEVWIHSDHGQEVVQNYSQKQGVNLKDAVHRAFINTNTEIPDIETIGHVAGTQSKRVALLSRRKWQPWFNQKNASDSSSYGQVNITAAGPIGFIYAKELLSREVSSKVAKELVVHANIPMVLANDGAGKVKVWSKEGEFLLPDDSDQVFGKDHPFLHDIGQDMLALCQHKDAGQLVICGWNKEPVNISFAIENGAHAGPGMNETHAFCLLPSDTVSKPLNRSYLRAKDLYHVAQQKLGHKETLQTESRLYPVGSKIRILTYNVHNCLGMDGKVSVHRIARVISQYQPDIIALQELDVNRQRSHGIHQTQVISEYLNMTAHYQPAMHVEQGSFGNAILTRLPVDLIKAAALPRLKTSKGLEPRAAICVSVILGKHKINVINTHLGLNRAERLMQTKALLSDKWLKHANIQGTTILCGDFNAAPNSHVYKKINQRLEDVQTSLYAHRPMRTFLTRFPIARIDHIFVTKDLKVRRVQVPRSALTRVASDHLPLIADLELNPLVL